MNALRFLRDLAKWQLVALLLAVAPFGLPAYRELLVWADLMKAGAA
jgi:hypothetical protein